MYIHTYVLHYQNYLHFQSNVICFTLPNWQYLYSTENYQDTCSVFVTKKTKDARHTSVLFTGNIKLPNSAFHISKTTKLISTKFIYFLPYVYTT